VLSLRNNHNLLLFQKNLSTFGFFLWEKHSYLVLVFVFGITLKTRVFSLIKSNLSVNGSNWENTDLFRDYSYFLWSEIWLY